MSRSRLAIALGVVPLLVVGGCSEDTSGPRVAPRETSAAPTDSPSASPTGPVEPTMPAAARKNSPAGAEAFVEYFLEVLNFAQESGRTAPLAEISTGECAACTGYVDAIDKTYGNGGRVRGGELEVGPLRELPKDYGADWGAFASGHSTPQVIFDGDGGKRSFPGGKFSLYAYTLWVDGHWAMQWMRTPA